MNFACGAGVWPDIRLSGVENIAAQRNPTSSQGTPQHLALVAALIAVSIALVENAVELSRQIGPLPYGFQGRRSMPVSNRLSRNGLSILAWS